LAIIRPFDLCAFKVFFTQYLDVYECIKFIKNFRDFNGKRKNYNIAPGLDTITINHIIEYKQKNGKS